MWMFLSFTRNTAQSWYNVFLRRRNDIVQKIVPSKWTFRTDADRLGDIYLSELVRNFRSDKWQRWGTRLHRSFHVILSQLYVDLEFPSYKFSTRMTVCRGCCTSFNERDPDSYIDTKYITDITTCKSRLYKVYRESMWIRFVVFFYAYI